MGLPAVPLGSPSSEKATLDGIVGGPNKYAQQWCLASGYSSFFAARSCIATSRSGAHAANAKNLLFFTSNKISSGLAGVLYDIAGECNPNLG